MERIARMTEEATTYETVTGEISGTLDGAIELSATNSEWLKLPGCGDYINMSRATSVAHATTDNGAVLVVEIGHTNHVLSHAEDIAAVLAYLDSVVLS